MVGELEAEAPDTQPVREALEVVRRNVELEARLIDDLLDVTRISKGKLQLSFETISIHQILQRAYEICRKEIEAKNLDVEFRLRATDTYVEGDPARLQQVFWNLIKNSVKFTPENGRIIVETLNPAPNKIEARIIDTGIGIEREKIDKIFNAFEQGQVEITRRFGGLGLGLSISKALIDAHGGKIHVESPGKDQGATFSVELTAVVTPIGGDGEKQDKPADREPERSGYELMREVRLKKDLPGIALSGFGSEQDVNQAREAGFAEHLTKPINFERLEKTMQSLLS